MLKMLKALVLLTILGPSMGHAYSGIVMGRFLYFEKRGPEVFPGDGPYTVDMKDTWRAVRHAQLYVYEYGTGALIGSGTTNGEGYYTIAWSSPISNPSVYVNFRFESAFRRPSPSNPRFRISSSYFVPWSSSTWVQTAWNYSITSFGDAYFGSASLAHKLCQLFETATQFWLTIGSTSANLNNRFGPVVIEFPVGSEGAWTWGPDRITIPDTGPGVFDGWVLGHELGHVVNLLQFEVTPGLTPNGANPDCSWGGSGHSWDSVEWQSCAFSEGFADFVGTATFYYPTASYPTAWGNDIETGCSGSDQWSESNVARMFWDIYDAWEDHWGDTHTMPFAWIVDKLNVYPYGSSNRQDREADADPNGTNAWDFYYHALYSGNGTNTDVQGELEANCLYGSDW